MVKAAWKGAGWGKQLLSMVCSFQQMEFMQQYAGLCTMDSFLQGAECHQFPLKSLGFEALRTAWACSVLHRIKQYMNSIERVIAQTSKTHKCVCKLKHKYSPWSQRGYSYAWGYTHAEQHSWSEWQLCCQWEKLVGKQSQCTCPHIPRYPPTGFWMAFLLDFQPTWGFEPRPSVLIPTGTAHWTKTGVNLQAHVKQRYFE